MSKQISRVNLTAGRVEAFTCPPDKTQAFLWDTDTPTLALRATPTGRKTYVFESRMKGSTIRMSIGTLADWPVRKARTRAQELKMLIDAGTDPRELERQQDAAKAVKAIAAAAHALTVGEVWPLYLATGRPKRKDAWK
ncbi:MAG: Arm DNA-binding domain-containing protein, partial [Polaromonas sp.]